MMSSLIHKSLSIAKCSTCSSSLKFKDTKSPSKDNEMDLKCTNCNSTYSFKNGYLNLLPPKIRAEICTSGILARKIKDGLHFSKLSKNEQDLVRGILASKSMAKQYFRNVVHPTQALLCHSLFGISLFIFHISPPEILPTTELFRPSFTDSSGDFSHIIQSLMRK